MIDPKSLTDEERKQIRDEARAKWEHAHMMLTLKVKALDLVLSLGEPLTEEQMVMLRKAVQGLGHEARTYSVLAGKGMGALSDGDFMIAMAEIELDRPK